MATRIGVDIGGTFTDLIYYDATTGEVVVGKVPTTPAAPEIGVLEALRSVLPSSALGQAEYFLHGTTVGLNALIERKGARVGLLTTRGFRDTLEIRRGDRDELFNLFWAPPPPLVPRRLRCAVNERVLVNGSVLVPLDVNDVKAALDVFDAEEVDCIAVCYLHSYANPNHELQTERELRRRGYTGEISLSHRVSGEYREYERTSTTVVDAYVRPRQTLYLKKLATELSELGLGGEMLLMRSGGGAISFSEAARRPFETINSGPVAGVEGAAELSRRLDLGDVIVADVGGTSFDTSLVQAGRAQLMYEGRVIGMPIQGPWIDVRSIGAGGGSIAHIEIGGALRVGPESAGAEPGPASYSRGGDQPTVTDAALLLGMLGTGVLAAGFTLSRERAEAAFTPLAERLGMTIRDAAKGVMTIATSNMANAIREITIEQGRDPRTAVLMPFGGAGPLFATLLAEELEIARIVVPPHAGNFSAWGLLGADIVQSTARTRVARLDQQAIDDANLVLEDLFNELHARAHTDGLESIPEVHVALRYAGQEHSLAVLLEESDGKIWTSPSQLYQMFSEEYQRTFGHSLEEPAEIVHVRATLRRPLPRRSETVSAGARIEGTVNTTTAYSFTTAAEVAFDLIDRKSLSNNDVLVGPAIVTEETTTLYLDVGFKGGVDVTGALTLQRSGSTLKGAYAHG